MIDINPNEVVRHEKVGNLEGEPVFQVGLKGGLSLILVKKGRSFETLGAASHPAIARHLAKKKKEKIEYTELKKSDHVPVEAFQDQLPYYEALTNYIRRRQGLE